MDAGCTDGEELLRDGPGVVVSHAVVGLDGDVVARAHGFASWEADGIALDYLLGQVLHGFWGVGGGCEGAGDVEGGWRLEVGWEPRGEWAPAGMEGEPWLDGRVSMFGVRGWGLESLQDALGRRSNSPSPFAN